MQKQNNYQQDLERKQTAGGHQDKQDKQANKGFEKTARRDEDMDDDIEQEEAVRSVNQAPKKDKNSKL